MIDEKLQLALLQPLCNSEGEEGVGLPFHRDDKHTHSCYTACT